MPYVLADSRAIANQRVLKGGVVRNDYLSSDYDVTLSRPVNKVKAVELIHAEIPNNKTVTEGWNDKLYFYDNDSTAASVEATLTPGYYTPDELINMINGVMTTAGTSTFTSTYDSNANHYDFVSTTNSRFLLFSEAIADSGITQDDYEAYFRALYLIGIDGLDTGSLSQSYDSEYEIDLRGVRYYTVNLELNGYGNQDVMTTGGSVSFVVPLNNNDLIGFSTYNKAANYPMINEINTVNVNNIRVKVFYEDSQVEREVLFFDTLFLFRLFRDSELIPMPRIG